MSKFIDNRVKGMKGQLSQMNDLDEVFRNVAALNDVPLSEARALSNWKGTKPFSIQAVMLLAINFDCKVEIDPILDTFVIWYAPKGEKVVELNEVEPEKERFEEIENTTGIPNEDIIVVEEKEEDDLF